MACGKPTTGEDVLQKHICVQKQTVALQDNISNFMANFLTRRKFIINHEALFGGRESSTKKGTPSAWLKVSMWKK